MWCRRRWIPSVIRSSVRHYHVQWFFSAVPQVQTPQKRFSNTTSSSCTSHFSVHGTTSLDAHTRTVISCEHHSASSAKFQCGHTSAQGNMSCASFIVFHIHPVSWCVCKTSRIVRSLAFCLRLRFRHQDLQRLPHPLQEQPKRARSLKWVWPNGGISTKHRLWAQARQLLQLHGSGPHAFQYRRQPSQFLVLGRRYHDSHKSWWFTEFRSIQQHQTSSSSWQSFITVGIFGIWKQSVSHVLGRLGPQEIGAELMRESVATTLFSSQSKGKRDRDTLCIRWERENLQNIFERKGDFAVRGGEKLSKYCIKLRLRLRREIGKGEIPTLLLERSIKNLNLNDFSYIKQVHGQIRLRETKLTCMEIWNWEIGSSKKIMQGIAKNSKNWEKICCEEIDQAIQARIEGLSLQQHRESFDCESNGGSNSGFTKQSKFFVICKRILRSWIREQLWSDPRSRSNSTILSSRILPRYDSGSPRNTQNCTGIMGNVFERPFDQEGWFSIIFNISKNFVVDICRFKETRRAIIRSRLRSSVHMLSKKKAQKRWAQ